MIDAAIIDLTHHLGRRPPAIVLPYLAAQAATTARASERLVRAAERWNVEWACDAQRHVDALRLETGPVTTQALRRLGRLVDLLTEQTDAQAATFRGPVKRIRRILKQVKARAPDDAARLAAERDRLSAAQARSCLIRFERSLALRAIRTMHDPAARSSPIRPRPKSTCARQPPDGGAPAAGPFPGAARPPVGGASRARRLPVHPLPARSAGRAPAPAAAALRARPSPHRRRALRPHRLRPDPIDGETVCTAADCGGHEIIEDWERAAAPRST